MGRATDLATLQFRMLNREQGAGGLGAARAVRPRPLPARRAHAARSSTLASDDPGHGRATAARRASAVAGVETLEGRRFGARAVVITTGTFLRGRIHIGTDHVDRRRPRRREPRRRIWPSSSSAPASRSRGSRRERRRASTGAPSTATALERQESEIEQFDYSWSHFWPSRAARRDGATRHPAQLPCWITYLGARGQGDHRRQHRRVGDVRRRDRVARPALLPVGRGQDREVSRRRAASALPRARGTRHDASCTSTGCRRRCPHRCSSRSCAPCPGSRTSAMTRAGYAIEYDYYPPTQLDATLQVRAIAGLVFRRPDQRHDRLRGGGGAGSGRRTQRRALAARASRRSCSAARRRTSACSSTIS